jgi:hypothetical protein
MQRADDREHDCQQKQLASRRLGKRRMISYAALTQLAKRDTLVITGPWQSQSAFAASVDGFGGIAALTSFVLASIALAKERPCTYGIIALCFSMLSLLLYIR